MNFVSPDIIHGIFFVGCRSRSRDVFNGYLQDVRVYAQSLDHV